MTVLGVPSPEAFRTTAREFAKRPQRCPPKRFTGENSFPRAKISDQSKESGQHRIRSELDSMSYRGGADGP